MSISTLVGSPHSLLNLRLYLHGEQCSGSSIELLLITRRSITLVPSSFTWISWWYNRNSTQQPPKWANLNLTLCGLLTGYLDVVVCAGTYPTFLLSILILSYLQPENLLLVSEEDDALVKVADFGFAQKFMPESGLTTQCGTPGYVAPEILMRK